MKIYLITSLLIFVIIKICKKINNIILTKEQRQNEFEDSKQELKNMAIDNEYGFIRRAASFFMKYANKIDKSNVLPNLIMFVMCFIPIFRMICLGFSIADVLVKLKNKNNKKTI